MTQGSPAGWSIVEHTADVGLRIWGRTAAELFEFAGRGLLQLMMSDPGSVNPAEDREIVLEASDLEEGLVSLLQEMIYRFEVERFVPRVVEITKLELPRITGRIRGERFDSSRHEARMDIKAATYHALEIRRTELPAGLERWEAVVIFDI